MILRKPHYIALVLVVVVVVVLFKLPGQTVARFKLAVSGLFLPLFGLAGSAHDLGEKTTGTLTSRSELLRQNEQLRRENQELTLRLREAAQAVRENERLNQLLGTQKKLPWKVKLARVLARDPSNWWRSLQIDLGSRDGVRANAPVLTTDGLVGRIQAVGETRSQVILLGDPNLRISALVETNGESGVIMSTSSSPQENNMVDLGFLSGNTTVHPGQTVSTSGDGGVFPKGIPIGRVVDLRSKDFGLSKEARVQLFANLNSLEEVWVMTGESAPAGNAELGTGRKTASPPAPHIARPATSTR